MVGKPPGNEQSEGGRIMGAIRVHEFISLDSVIDTPSWTFDF